MTNATKTRLALFPLLLVLGIAFGQESVEPVRLGGGAHTFHWVTDWARLPDDMRLGNTHGCVIVDSQDRVYVNTDTENAVIVFAPDGEFLGAWGAELAGGLHGMALVREGDDELLYLTHTGRHEVLKATLEGKILWRLGYPEEAGIYSSPEEYRPTSIAVADDGGFYVADGYGASWIHQYDAERNYVRSFGGPGEEKGKLRTPHGLLMDSRGETPALLVADRENHRLQTFDLEGESEDLVEGMLRRPCHMHSHGKDLVVADLAGRVTILDGDNELVVQLGDNPDPGKRARNDVPPEEWRDGEFLSPHCASWDSKGNLYVVDWNAKGRVSKLRRVE